MLYFDHQILSKEFCEFIIKNYLREHTNYYSENTEVELIVEDGEIICRVLDK